MKRVARFDDGTELGPRVFKAGIIDGTGELAGPTKMRVDTAEEAIKDVDWYADHGYVQIKIYSSIKPELVPVIADRAHARGMRVSGHVPAFMSAQQFVEGGADEIQHLNFIELNFLFPEVKETRNRDRFIKVAEHAREFTPDKPRGARFHRVSQSASHRARSDDGRIRRAFLRRPDRGDARLGRDRAAFSAAGPALDAERRAGSSGGQSRRVSGSVSGDAAFVQGVHDAGVTIIPGTDALPGYTLHHELEIYVRAGIPAAEVLRMATLTSGAGHGREQRSRRDRRRENWPT